MSATGTSSNCYIRGIYPMHHEIDVEQICHPLTVDILTLMKGTMPFVEIYLWCNLKASFTFSSSDSQAKVGGGNAPLAETLMTHDRMTRTFKTVFSCASSRLSRRCEP